MGTQLRLTATVLPTGANDRTVTWSVADEDVATVSARGLVAVSGVGETTVTAVCNDDPEITRTISERGLALAEGIVLDSLSYTVALGDTVQTYPMVTPADTADATVNYQIDDPSIATVDENGVVTGVSAGRTTLYAKTADGSNLRACAAIEVVVPVTGVSYSYKDIRVDTGVSTAFTATLAPADATDTRMTWESSDESVATVSGITNRFVVLGRSFGRCKLTGTTQDGGYTVSVYADVGSLTHAVVITEAGLRDGKPYVIVENRSGMTLSQMRYRIQGYDETLTAIAVSVHDDPYVLEGACNLTLVAGERCGETDTTLYNPADLSTLSSFRACITGWSTSTGFYDANGQLQKNNNPASPFGNGLPFPRR